MAHSVLYDRRHPLGDCVSGGAEAVWRLISQGSQRAAAPLSLPGEYCSIRSMANSERTPQPETPQSEHQKALADIQRRIEVADADENPIERSRKLDTLCEERDWLEDDADSSAHQQELP